MGWVQTYHPLFVKRVLLMNFSIGERKGQRSIRTNCFSVVPIPSREHTVTLILQRCHTVRLLVHPPFDTHSPPRDYLPQSRGFS